MPAGMLFGVGSGIALVLDVLDVLDVMQRATSRRAATSAVKAPSVTLMLTACI